MKIVLVLALAGLCAGANVTSRQDCSADFKLCAPSGARADSLGPIGANWVNLFSDIVNAVNDDKLSNGPVTTVDPSGPARRASAFCCSDVASCLLLAGYEISMCWDRFTTNVFFPDGTYGTVVTGDFNTSNGDTINLVYGDYTLKGGASGNIYSSGGSSTAKPDTTTLSMPTPWTSKGQGSAIPATGLGTTGRLSTGTTVIPATTEAASTGEPITVVANATGCARCPAFNTTISGPIQPGGTYPASTSVFTTAIITPTITGTSDGCNLRVGIPQFALILIFSMLRACN